jgi:hypothetical protein
MRALLRAIGYLWALPVSVLGLLLAILYMPRQMRWSDGALEFQARWIFPWWWSVGGQTIGFVIFYSKGWGRPHTRLHERWHVRQAMILGPLFPVLYGLASLVAACAGLDFYRDNAFELQAEGKSDLGLRPW